MEEQKLFSIGQMASWFHLSQSSIRYYEKSGLLEPEHVDPDTGYRYYSTRQFEIFNTIRYLRALDMPLPQIADFLQNRDVGRIEEKLRQQKQEVARRQQELARIERKIDNRLRQLREAQTTRLDAIERVDCGPCRLFWLGQTLRITDCSQLELPTIQLAREQTEALIFLGKIGVSVSEEHLRAGDFSQYDGMFLAPDAEDQVTGEPICLPASACVRVRFGGSHLQSPERYRRLMDYIRANHLQPTGFSREITLIDYGLTNDPEKFVTEITIPVRET